MAKMLKVFERFYADCEANEMFVTGRAGTGKTTELAHVIRWCEENNIQVIVCAFTHKAVAILRDKLPSHADCRTIWSYLKKAPTINEEALRKERVTVAKRFGEADKPALVVIDEYSQVTKLDKEDLQAMKIKLLWLGDPYQLPPVGENVCVQPKGEYAMELTKVYRQSEGNPLLQTLDSLINMIDTGDTEPLGEHEKLKRGANLVEEYKKDPDNSVALAYTNKVVQQLNAEIEGKPLPAVGDNVFSPNLRQHLSFEGVSFNPDRLLLPNGKFLDVYDDTYRTLPFLTEQLGLPVNTMINEMDDEVHAVTVFGHYAYKSLIEGAKSRVARANKAISESQQVADRSVAKWAKANFSHPYAQARRRAYREFLALDQNVLCLDFPHAMTVHKSQGSTFKRVLVDMEDLEVAQLNSDEFYLKLVYVAMSRASDCVITN